MRGGGGFAISKRGHGVTECDTVGMSHACDGLGAIDSEGFSRFYLLFVMLLLLDEDLLSPAFGPLAAGPLEDIAAKMNRHEGE